MDSLTNVIPFPMPAMMPAPEPVGTVGFLKERRARIAAEQRDDWVLAWDNGLCIARREDGIMTIGGVEEAQGFKDGKDLPLVRNGKGEPARLQHRPDVVHRELQRLDRMIAALGT